MVPEAIELYQQFSSCFLLDSPLDTLPSTIVALHGVRQCHWQSRDIPQSGLRERQLDVTPENRQRGFDT
jgi:hypothetical protein